MSPTKLSSVAGGFALVLVGCSSATTEPAAAPTAAEEQAAEPVVPSVTVVDQDVSG